MKLVLFLLSYLECLLKWYTRKWSNNIISPAFLCCFSLSFPKVLGYLIRNELDTKNLIKEIKGIASHPTDKYFFNVSSEAALLEEAGTLGERIFSIEGKILNVSEILDKILPAQEWEFCLSSPWCQKEQLELLHVWGPPGGLWFVLATKALITLSFTFLQISGNCSSVSENFTWVLSFRHQPRVCPCASKSF